MSNQENLRKAILAPLDLTELSAVAIEHAFYLADKADADLHFRHWVKDSEDIAPRSEEMNALIESGKAKHGNSVSYSAEVSQGDYMESIAQECEVLKPMLVIVGTHGLQGMEFFTGTHAIRIVGDVDVPVMVIQNRGVRDGYGHITVPMELEAESKQKLPVVAKMAQLFEATVHLFSPSSDDEFYRNSLTRNMNYAREYLTERGVTITVDQAEQKQRDLDMAVDRQVNKYDTDLIIITNWHESKVIDLFSTEDTQDIMLNEAMVPVILVNPREVGDFDLFGWG